MRKALLTAAVGASLFPAARASAALLVYEPFDYTAGNDVFGETNSSNGQTWVRAGVANPPSVINVAAANLTVPSGVPAPVGNHGEIDGIGNGSGSTVRLALGSATTSGTVYVSFALRIDELTGSNTTSGGFFLSLNNSTGTQTTNPSIAVPKVSGRIDPTDGTKYNLGITNALSPDNGTANTTWTGPMTVGDTLYIVAAYTFNGGTNDDVSSIWINPGNLGDPSAPAPTMTEVGGTDLGQIASLLLRQSPAPHVSIDEVRVGTTWADVTPVPEPTALAGIGACGLLALRRRRK